MSVTLTQTKKKEDKSLNAKHIQDMLKSEGWNLYSKFLAQLKDEAMYHVLSVDVESIRFRERLRTIDEIQEVPDILIKESLEIKRQQEDRDG